MSKPLGTKQATKEHRTRKNPQAAEKFAELRHAKNAERPKQVWAGQGWVTKIDWAYKQADKLMCRTTFKDANNRIRKVAGALRRAEKRGQKNEQFCQLLRSQPKLAVAQVSAATIRECEKQLKAIEIKPNKYSNHHFEVHNTRLVDNLGGYHERCVHSILLRKECKSCGRM